MKLYPNRRTHIDTLADATPKSRRRVRALNGLGPIWPVNTVMILAAQKVARGNETAEAQRVLARKAAAGVVS